MTTLPYGSWPSPITAAAVASGGVTLSAVEVNDHGVFWLEGRPLQGGRNVLVHRAADGRGSDVTPPGFNVRTRVHEYGGGAFLLDGATVFFCNFADQRMYRQDPGRAPRPITEEPSTAAAVRYADARITPDRRMLVCVRETHRADGEVVNELAALDPDGSGAQRTLVSGRDFFAAPRPSPDGSKLAWVCWDHPQMPWDGTELWVAGLGPRGDLGEPRLVAGSETESVTCPAWSPDGVLHYLSDRTGWWNLYTSDGQALAPMDAEVGGPAWTFAGSYFAFLRDGRIAVVYRRDGFDHLAVVRRGSAASPDAAREVRTSYTSFSSLRTDGTRLYAIAASASTAPQVVAVGPETEVVEVVARSRGDEVEAAYLSSPRPIEFPTAKGRTAHALFYPPANREAQAPPDERPPLIVFSHGGPTGSTNSTLNLTIQYFTSRGLAVVDVNYGGSTGYGREYRDRLKGTWGVVDVEDCVNAARWLARQGEVDGKRLAIRGGSAGGYTTLCALAFTDVFACGASYYGVADAEALARDTHKFESRYLDGLIGPYPEAAELYRQRSAIHNVHRMSCPVIFFQGLEDRIVPPEQAVEMVRALDEKRIPHAYLAFDGEQHGFRKAETVVRTLEAELYFYSRVLGFEPAGSLEPVEIAYL